LKSAPEVLVTYSVAVIIENIHAATARELVLGATRIGLIDDPIDPKAHPQRQEIEATGKRLPSVYGYRQHVDAGGLISYGVNLDWCNHRAAYYVASILKGAKPADLPIEFPTNLELVINLKTAKALGLQISPMLLTRADEVIE
jgi:ABC transporter substrate binding protein